MLQQRRKCLADEITGYIYLSLTMYAEEAVCVPVAAVGNFAAVREEKVHVHQLSCNYTSCISEDRKNLDIGCRGGSRI